MDKYRQIGPLACLIPEEMEYVVALPLEEKKNIIISGYVDFTLHRIMLFRGDGTNLIVSMAFFVPNSKQQPDFDNFFIIDHGLTLSFGEYEAAVDCILYDHDTSYKSIQDANKKAN